MEVYSGRHLGLYVNGNFYMDYKNQVQTTRMWTAYNSSGSSSIQTCTELPFGDARTCSGTSIDQDFFGDFRVDVDGEYASPTRRLNTTQDRWQVPDPSGLAVVDPSNPQSWNRYAYVMNNPLSFIDPTGLACWPLEKAMFGSCAPFMNNGVNFGSNWNEFGILGILLGPGQTGDVTVKINDVPVSETMTYYGGDLSILNLIGGSNSWGWTFTKSFFGGFSLKTGPGSCLGVALDSAQPILNVAKSVQTYSKTYVAPLAASLPAAGASLQGAIYSTVQFGADKINAAMMVGAVAAATDFISAKAAAGLAAVPTVLGVVGDAALAYGVGNEAIAAYQGKCH
jgi:RHS repeat-associated protein